MSVKDCKLIKLPTFADSRGKLSVVESAQSIPFKIERIFYMYGHPEFSSRGHHAHKTFEQLIIPMSGSFIVDLDDGTHSAQYQMCEPGVGLYISPMIWVKVFDLKPTDICLILTSDHYLEDDYIRDYNEFLSLIQRSNT